MQRKHGFTLIELLVVISIIALLVAILMPSLSRARELMQRAACGMNLNSIGKGLAMYKAQYDDDYPWIAGSDRDWTTTDMTAGGKSDSNFYDLGKNLLANLNLLVKEGTLAYDQFLCPSAGTQSATRGTGDNNEWGFRMYEGADQSNNSYYAIDYAYHLGAPYTGGGGVGGGGNLATFGDVAGGFVIMGDYNPDNETEIESPTAWNHNDDGVNLLTTSHSVTLERPNDSDRIIVNGDNVYASPYGTSAGSADTWPAGDNTKDAGQDQVLYTPKGD
ncbi:MAG: type II secretion system protein [Planctomycetota bacterium]